MIIALLANPDSGDGDSKRVARLLRRDGARVREFAPDQAEEAARGGAERIAVAGGDGSIAAAASAAGRAGIPVAVIPVGTANDFAAAAGLPEGLDEACRLAARGPRLRRTDLAWLGERPFVNVASAGLAPQAAKRASGLKRALGPLAYLLGALAAATRSRPVRCALECDGEPLFAGEAWQAVVGSSGAFGAGSSIGGSSEDGLLRAVAVPAGSRLGLLRRAYGLRRGTVAAQPGVAAAEGRRVELDLAPGTELNVDGELVESGPVAVRIEPGAFELVVG
jgi:diacylglycerol kinase family enzyme